MNAAKSRKYIAQSLMCFVFVLSGCKHPESSIIKDADGNIYHSVQIGKQLWLIENLRTTRFSDGSFIKNGQSANSWKQMQEAAYCCYPMDSNSIKTYGLLYNWYAIHDAKSIAPQGWRVPTEKDIQQLLAYIHSDTSNAIFLKEAGNQHWLPSFTVGNNATGFNALPGGYRDAKGNFYMQKSNGYYWNENGSIELYHWSARVYAAFADVHRDSSFKQFGFSVKCVQDIE